MQVYAGHKQIYVDYRHREDMAQKLYVETRYSINLSYELVEVMRSIRGLPFKNKFQIAVAHVEAENNIRYTTGVLDSAYQAVRQLFWIV